MRLLLNKNLQDIIMAKDQEDNGKELLRSMEEQLAMIEEDFRPEISDIESITPIFESEADRAKMRLFQQRQKMNNVLGDLLKTRENDTATLLINHPDFQYDPTRKLGDQNYIEYALNNNNDAVVMALLNQPFDVISTLLRHTDILESFLK